MAWNPSPEVQIVRDAAKRMSEQMGAPADRCVIIFTTVDGQLGYASYGRDRERCSQARKMGNAAYDAIMRDWDDICPDVPWDGTAGYPHESVDARDDVLRLLLEACRVSLSAAVDCNEERDDLGEDFFHVKALKQAIAAAKEAGLLE